MLALLLVVFFSYSSYCNAQQLGTTDCSTDGSVNFITGTTCAANPSTHLQQSQTVFDSTQNTLPNFNSGSFNNGATGTIFTWNGNKELWWQHTQDTYAVSIAINQALRSAGIKIDGYHMQMEIFNKNHNTIGGNCLVAKTNGKCLDVLELKIIGYDAAGNQVSLDTYDYSGLDTHNINPSASDPNWSQQNIFSWAPTQVGVANVEVEIFGYDAGYWRGNYGPRVKNMVGSVIYSADICVTNPLHDASCSGYASALFTQACNANPLFDSSCPGYATALLTQQCNANTLYDPSCPGYAAAYLANQCKLDPLYDSSCPGYSIAYQTKKCTNDPTSDPSCPDYYVAMCEANPLFDIGCIGYDVAYFDQQCTQDNQYDQSCPGYVDLSGNDGDIAIFDPIVEDVITVEPELDFYEPEVPVYTPTYTEEIVEVEPESIEINEYQQVLEDDIEREIAELENEGDAMNMEDDIEKEIAQLENSTSSDRSDADPVVNGGKEVMEDDIEKEIAELEQESDTDEGDTKSTLEDGVQVADSNARPDKVDNSPKSSKRENVPNPDASKRDKIKWLIAQKAIEATKELENAVTLEQQMNIQRRLLALISFVPDFSDYGEKENVNQVNFYPPKPTVDHAYARWFLNDPNFGAMENLQYPNLR